MDSGKQFALGTRDDFPDPSSRLIELEGKMIALIRQGERFYAIEERCSHRAGPLSEGTIVNGKVKCPWHGAEFDLLTGAVCTGPARRNLAIHQVIERGDTIFLKLNEDAAT